MRARMIGAQIARTIDSSRILLVWMESGRAACHGVIANPNVSRQIDLAAPVEIKPNTIQSMSNPYRVIDRRIHSVERSRSKLLWREVAGVHVRKDRDLG